MMKKKTRKNQPKFVEAFSPTIMETKVSDRFLEIVNTVGDDVLSSEQKSVQYDWSHKLVGKVSKEVQIPVRNDEERVILFTTMKQACVDYLNYIIDKNRSYGWWKMAGRERRPTMENIHLTHSWIVSQYAGEYNPAHHHTGDFSAVIYLKIPPKMQSEFDIEFQDHYPANGLIEFMYGENCDMRSDTIKYKPEVGTMLVFPSYLKHFVYPFYSEGERRSMSFNAHMKL
jgi:hypothetical protein